MSDKMPTDPITDLAAAAVQLHELYESYVAAGFTGAQAMQMVCTIIAASMGASP